MKTAKELLKKLIDSLDVTQVIKANNKHIMKEEYSFGIKTEKIVCQIITFLRETQELKHGVRKEK